MRRFLPVFTLLLTACAAVTLPEEVATTASSVSSKSDAPAFAGPLPRTGERTILKPFGMKISPADSPVSPEKFSGYHTGIDYEIFDSEVSMDVPVFAICSGAMREKRNVGGYGGVLIQDCSVNNEVMTVLYGHLRLSSIERSTNETLVTGETIGKLGSGFTSETSGERKHLHLGIHRGSSIELRGYTQKQDALADWMDPATLLH